MYLAPARIALLFLLSSAFAAELEVRAATRGVQDVGFGGESVLSCLALSPHPLFFVSEPQLWKAVALVLNTAIDLAGATLLFQQDNGSSAHSSPPYIADIDVVSPPLDGTAEAADLEPLPEDRDFLGKPALPHTLALPARILSLSLYQALLHCAMFFAMRRGAGSTCG